MAIDPEEGEPSDRPEYCVSQAGAVIAEGLGLPVGQALVLREPGLRVRGGVSDVRGRRSGLITYQ
jgi:hypothetical protein